jgi:hypothetical protein
MAQAFQRIYTRLEGITKATVVLNAQGVANDELATVDGRRSGLKYKKIRYLRIWRTEVLHKF